MKLVYVHETDDGAGARSIFLAGPSPRSQDTNDWRRRACLCLTAIAFDGSVYIPLPRDGRFGGQFDRAAQNDWELAHLEKAGAIVFWIPRDLVSLPGFTTNVEFGRFSRQGNVVLGYPQGAPKMGYLHHLALLDGVPVFHTLEETLQSAVERCISG